MAVVDEGLDTIPDEVGGRNPGQTESARTLAGAGTAQRPDLDKDHC